MTRREIAVYTCDGCGKEDDADFPLVIYPYNSFAVKLKEDGEVFSHQILDDRHFCSEECLILWISNTCNGLRESATKGRSDNACD